MVVWVGESIYVPEVRPPFHNGAARWVTASPAASPPSLPPLQAGCLGWAGLDEAVGNLFRAGLFQQHIINHVLLASAYSLAVLCYSDLQNIIICWSQACRLMWGVGSWQLRVGVGPWSHLLPVLTPQLCSPLGFWLGSVFSHTTLCKRKVSSSTGEPQPWPRMLLSPGPSKSTLWALGPCHIIDHSPLMLGEQRCWMHPSSLLVLQCHISPSTLSVSSASEPVPSEHSQSCIMLSKACAMFFCPAYLAVPQANVIGFSMVLFTLMSKHQRPAERF